MRARRPPSLAGGGTAQIWDTRSAAEWSGENDRGNRRRGHVPGARLLEWRELMQGPPARHFLPPDELRARLRAAGIDPDAETVTYCQAGVRGAFGVFVLRLLGSAHARHYDGSMGAWANRDHTPLVIEHRRDS